MSDLREQFVKQLQESIGIRYIHGDIADKLIALIPKPTVRVKCDKCGGCGEIDLDDCCPECHGAGGHGGADVESDPFIECGTCDGKQHESTVEPCTCADGWNEHLIDWVCLGFCLEENSRTLTLPDLIDPDVAGAYHVIHDMPSVHIPHNKGTLRIGGKVK